MSSSSSFFLIDCISIILMLSILTDFEHIIRQNWTIWPPKLSFIFIKQRLMIFIQIYFSINTVWRRKVAQTFNFQLELIDSRIFIDAPSYSNIMFTFSPFLEQSFWKVETFLSVNKYIIRSASSFVNQQWISVEII